MSVHVGELRTDVRAATEPPPPGGDPDLEGVLSASERADDARRRADWLACRVHAEGFDD